MSNVSYDYLVFQSSVFLAAYQAYRAAHPTQTLSDEMEDLLAWTKLEEGGARYCHVEGDVVHVNPEYQNEYANYYDHAECLQALKVPYRLRVIGDGTFESFWEYYDPSVSENPKTAYLSASCDDDYLLNQSAIRALEHLPGEAFKEAVLALSRSPFASYPKW